MELETKECEEKDGKNKEELNKAAQLLKLIDLNFQFVVRCEVTNAMKRRLIN